MVLHQDNDGHKQKTPMAADTGHGPPDFLGSWLSSSIYQPQKPGFESLVPVTQMLNGAGIVTNVCPKNHPNVGKYTIHGAYGLYRKVVLLFHNLELSRIFSWRIS